MVRKPVQIGALNFPRKKDANDFFREMLYRYDLGDKVSKDDAVLAQLLSKHPEATEKIGAGIESFSVRAADYGTRCFWVNRVDGSFEKFSFKACF